ncbi:MAG: sodium/proline symporter [Chlamydiae bacterium CG10_big_fil_rev_8_21_14_0_10_35_9]|nr:MAG: sodium/proline symporter [Chlamydiae bacterium CG10_big_fil_rev_8_21_14_0_10_35_9]
MNYLEIITFTLYFAVVLLIVFLSYKKQKSDKDFILGDRKLNFWLTALSAHASDMSSWLFLAYPAQIFLLGGFNIWAGIGLTLFMYLNWQFIAPKVRIATEQTNSLTLNAYFENRFADRSSSIRLVSGLMTLLFFTIYICAGLVGMGFLVESLFGVHYAIGISIGLFIVMLYVFLGGYTTVAWIDLFQGFFLLGVILVIPVYLLFQLDGFTPIATAAKAQNLSLSLLPDFKPNTLYQAFILTAGWGLGYLGQPHIITKFMGIKNVQDMSKSKYLGISWQILALTGATLIGLIGIALFPNGLENPELLILNVVQQNLHPFFAGLVLCAILAATTNVMAAQILVVASSLCEDFYKRLFRKKAKPKELLWVSRFSVLFISCIAFIVALFKVTTIYKLVLYAWTGLGTSFGPLLLISLYSKKINRFGAFAGILTGGTIAAIGPYLGTVMKIEFPSMIVGFAISSLSIISVSKITKKYELQKLNLEN